MLKRIATLFLLLIGLNGNAQRQFIGVKAGVNAATATAALDASYVQWGLHAGVFQERQLTSSLRFKGELLYSQKGWRWSFFEPAVGLIDLSFRLNYLDGLLGLYWEVLPSWEMYPGVQLSYLLEERTTIQPSQLVVEYENPSRLEFAPVIGSRYRFTDHWGTDARFTYSTWSSGGFATVRSAVLLLSVEFTF